jgi:hypothetical protein
VLEPPLPREGCAFVGFLVRRAVSQPIAKIDAEFVEKNILTFLNFPDWETYLETMLR